MTVPSPSNQEEQQTSTMINTTVSPVSESERQNNYHNPSNLLRSRDSEVIRSELRTIVSQLTALAHSIVQQEKDHEKSEDWQFLAMVIDRLCFILFIIFLIVSSILALISVNKLVNIQHQRVRAW